MVERAWRMLALAVVAGAVLVANYDPVVSGLPDLPQGGGLPVSESAKQAFVLAGSLTLLAVLGALWLILRPAVAAPGQSLRVIAPAAVAAVAVFLVLYAQSSDDRGWLAAGTLVVLGIAGVVALESPPAMPPVTLSRLPLVATVAAVALIVGYAAVIQFMFARAGTENETEWERLVTLFAGIESIGFAAVGALLGQQVQKTQTDVERDRADENADAVVRAKALGAGLQTKLEAIRGAADPSAADTAFADAERLAAQIADLPAPALR
jgi:hypothetical protein